MRNRRAVRLPKILTMQRDFHEVDKFMNALEHDTVIEAKFRDGTWRIAATTLDKETFCVLTAFEGWNDCFRQIAEALGEFTYSDAPLRELLDALKAETPIKESQIERAKDVISAQRKLYLRAPPMVINTVVKTAEELEVI
jgi:hypothetical protein